MRVSSTSYISVDSATRARPRVVRGVEMSARVPGEEAPVEGGVTDIQGTVY
jgi:hypothetical protein